MLLFGVRELPGPKGWGYLYFKIPSSKGEFFVDNLDLHQTSDNDLRLLFKKGVRQAEIKAEDSERVRKLLANGEYQTKNIADWAAEILKEAIDQHFRKEADKL